MFKRLRIKRRAIIIGRSILMRFFLLVTTQWFRFKREEVDEMDEKSEMGIKLRKGPALADSYPKKEEH